MRPMPKYHKYRLAPGRRTENYNRNLFYLALTWICAKTTLLLRNEMFLKILAPIGLFVSICNKIPTHRSLN